MSASDRTPIVPPTAPPTYIESVNQAAPPCDVPVTNSSLPSAPPPPYSPPKQGYIVETTTPGYQRFDVIPGAPVEVLSVVHLGSEPCQVLCPKCGNHVMTQTSARAGAITFVSAALCFLFCIVCTFLPFCVDDLQDVVHYCPVCKNEIGVYSRI